MWPGCSTLRDAGTQRNWSDGAMPETENTTETTETTESEVEPTPDESLGDAGQKAIAAERDARKKVERELREARKAEKALQDQVKQFEDRDKTEAQKAADRVAELEKALADKDSVIAAKDRDTARATVAAAKGVPLHLVTGDTVEEMEAAAEAALEWKGTERKPAGFRSGASTPNPADAKDRAAQSLRTMWANK
jgi:L-lactate utilization protein LutC